MLIITMVKINGEGKHSKFTIIREVKSSYKSTLSHKNIPEIIRFGIILYGYFAEPRMKAHIMFYVLAQGHNK